MGGPDMGGLILYGACNGGPVIVRNVPNPAPNSCVAIKNVCYRNERMLREFTCTVHCEPH